MKELVATGDLVLLSALKYHLDSEGIEFDTFDGYVGSLFPGEMSVASSRIMVIDEHYDRAKRLLKSLQDGEMACE
ncbi:MULTISPECIES: DUF2007 domain-containing protein [Terasakiella]|uniref:DUF2007 domain-containing protein n=1 Tax=Terasakiella brassicae TaxID=1634917 RepID=A0A917C7V5_9PROT|nr:DUF2007 domain-containing protein [Terasakiella brassicae]GGF76597.1 hypothetical protein GCM10011332_33250 [Terasakiella brassicae]